MSLSKREYHFIDATDEDKCTNLYSIKIVHSQNSATLVFITQEAKSFCFSGFLVSYKIYVNNFTISVTIKQILTNIIILLKFPQEFIAPAGISPRNPARILRKVLRVEIYSHTVNIEKISIKFCLNSDINYCISFSWKTIDTEVQN